MVGFNDEFKYKFSFSIVLFLILLYRKNNSLFIIGIIFYIIGQMIRMNNGHLSLFLPFLFFLFFCCYLLYCTNTFLFLFLYSYNSTLYCSLCCFVFMYEYEKKEKISALKKKYLLFMKK